MSTSEAPVATGTVTVRVNGSEYAAEVDLRCTLVDALRGWGLTGTHVGCTYEGRCGACTVLVDGRATKSCLMLAVQADGSDVRTVEGLSEGADLHPVQDAFRRCHGLQCGFCTPGMLMTTCDLLASAGEHTVFRAEIREQISGNICRCTGYTQIVDAICEASQAVRALPAGERDELLGRSPR